MTKTIRKIIGVIVSDKMDKTRVIEIREKRAHPIYQKTFAVTRKIKAHDQENQYHLGDKVEITETKPFSKTKAWQISKLISSPLNSSEK